MVEVKPMNLTALHYLAIACLCLAGVFGTLSHTVPAQAALFASLAGVFAALSTALGSQAPAAIQSPQKQLVEAEKRIASIPPPKGTP